MHGSRRWASLALAHAACSGACRSQYLHSWWKAMAAALGGGQAAGGMQRGCTCSQCRVAPCGNAAHAWAW